MKLRLAPVGPSVSVPPFLGFVLLLDLLLALALTGIAGFAATTGRGWPTPPPLAWGVAGFGVLVVLVDVAAGRMSPKGLTWRRRLGYVGMGAVAWRGGPFTDVDVRIGALVVLYLGVVWVALVVGGRTLSRAIASATGEDKPE